MFFIYLFILFKVLGIRLNVHFGSRTGGAGKDHGLRHALLVHARYLQNKNEKEKEILKKVKKVTNNRVISAFLTPSSSPPSHMLAFYHIPSSRPAEDK